MKLFNYFLIIYFSFGACIPKSDFSQIGQLDELLDHYNLHKEEANQAGVEISFGEFLYMHFIQEENHKHPNDNDHQELPFFSVTGHTVLFMEHFEYSIKSLKVFVNKRGISQLDSFYLNPYINNIFHPPASLSFI